MKLYNFFRKEYRIVRDDYAGYEVQARRWYFPVWIQVSTNTYPSIEKAESFAKLQANKEVKRLGKL